MRLLLLIIFLLLECVGLNAAVYYSRQTGPWNDRFSWTTLGCGSMVAAASAPGAGDDVVVCSNITISVTANAVINNLEIQSGGVVNTTNKTFQIDGNLIVEGTLMNISGGKDIDFTGGSGQTIGGDGVIDIKDIRSFIVNGDCSSLSSAKYTIVNDFTIANGVTFTNNGNIYIGRDLIGGDAASTWVNAIDSRVAVKGILLATGTLTASASGNTVDYINNAAQNVKTPTANTYHNLTMSGSSTLTQAAGVDLILNGNFTINSGTYSCNNRAISLKGNWTDKGTFTYGTGTVTFDGTTDQTILKSVGTEQYYNLIVSKSNGILYLVVNTTARNSLTMTSGNISTGSYILKVGYGTAAGQEGTLLHTSGTVIGYYQKYVRASGSYTFPVGTAANYRPAIANFTMTSVGSITATFNTTNPGNNGLSLADGFIPVYNSFSEGYWALSSSGFTASSYNLQLVGTGFTSFFINPATRLLIRANSSSNWIVEGTHVAAAGFTAERTGLTTLSAEYCFGDTTNCTAPVTSAISGNNSVCVNDLAESYSVTNTPGSWYQWSLSPAAAGTVDPATQGTNNALIDWDAVGYNTTISVIENNGCTTGNPVLFSVTSNPVAPTTITGALSVPVGATGIVYTVPDLGYTYTWTISQGSSDPNPASGQNTNSITVDWNAIEGMGSVSVVATDVGCGQSSPPISINVQKYVTINSIATGNWSNAATWDCNCIPLPTDNVRIMPGHDVTLTAATTINSLSILATGRLLQSIRNITLTGNLIVYGQMTGTGSVYMTGPGSYIDGTGFISSNNFFIQATTDILASAVITKNTFGSLSISAGTTVTNYGSFDCARNIAALAGSTWYNEENATLKMAGSLSSNIILFASSIGNTVEYYAVSPLTIRKPVNSTYYHLVFSGTSVMTLADDLDINGNFTISNSAQVDVTASNYNLNIAGNWSNTSTNADPFLEQLGTVTFDGNSDLTITSSSATLPNGETFYNLVMNKTTGNVTLNDNVTVSNQLTMTQGNIDAGTNRITVGTAIGTPGSLSHTSGTIIGEYEKWIASTGTYKFPIGNSANYNGANLNLVAGLTNGSVISKFVTADPTGLPVLSESGINIIDRFNDGYWNFTANNSFAITDYNIDLTATGFSNYTINSATRIIKRTNGGAWVLDGTHSSSDGTICYRNGLNGISDAGTGTQFGLGHTDCATFSSPVITGNGNVCSAADQVYSVPNTGRTYTWTITGGASDPNPTVGQGTYQVTVTWGTPSITAKVRVVESGGCYTAPATEKNITIHTLPTSAISGPNNVPENSTQGPYTVTSRAGYTYTWSVPIGNYTPPISGDGTSSVTVAWTNPSLPATLRVVGQYMGCPVAPNSDYSVTVYGEIVSQADGNWDNPAIWVGGNVPDVNTESARIQNNVVLNNSYTIMGLKITGTGNLTNSGANILTINGNYHNDGTHDANNRDIILDAIAVNQTISGIGSVSNYSSFQIKGNSHVISSGTNLTLNGTFDIYDNITINNYGTINITGNLTDNTNPGSAWFNRDNSTLKIGGSVGTRLTLYSNLSGNNVYYNGAGAQAIKTPNSNKYWNLFIEGGNTKSLSDNLILDGDLTIGGTATLDVTASNYSLNIKGNWINTSIFNERTNATVMFDGLVDQTIDNAAGEIFCKLTVASQGSLILSNADITVSNLLTLTKGAILTGAYKVILPNTSTSNTGDDDSFVDGVIRKTGNAAFTFPTGNGNVWAPIGLSNISTGIGDSFDAQYFYSLPNNRNNLGPGIDHVSWVEYWDVTPTDPLAEADVTLYWKDAERSGITDIVSGDLIILRYNTGTSLWENMTGVVWGGSTTGPGGSGYITAPFDHFTDPTFGSGTGTNPLPVELFNLNASCNGNIVFLDWKTASENNNNYFTIERSTDALNWRAVGIINGAGNSSVLSSYSFADTSLFSNRDKNRYYRLKQTDFNGKYKYSNIITVENCEDNDIKLAIYPNPSNGKFNITSNCIISNVRVTNLIGQQVYFKENTDETKININISNFQKGIYIVEINCKNEVIYKKIINQ